MDVQHPQDDDDQLWEDENDDDAENDRPPTFGEIWANEQRERDKEQLRKLREKNPCLPLNFVIQPNPDEEMNHLINILMFGVDYDRR